MQFTDLLYSWSVINRCITARSQRASRYPEQTYNGTTNKTVILGGAIGRVLYLCFPLLLHFADDEVSQRSHFL